MAPAAVSQQVVPVTGPACGPVQISGMGGRPGALNAAGIMPVAHGGRLLVVAPVKRLRGCRLQSPGSRRADPGSTSAMPTAADALRVRLVDSPVG